MFKYIFVLILFTAISVFPQKGFQGREGKTPDFNLRKPVLIESHVVPSDTLFICYFSYKIPFNNILFLKDGDNFTGEISLKLEIHEKDTYLKSETVNKKITVGNYELTNSDYDFIEGVVEIKLNEGSYSVKPNLKIENLNRDILMPPFPLEINEDELKNVLEPIVLFKDSYSYNEQNYYRLVNAEGFIPFSIQDYNLGIPVTDLSINEIDVSVIQDDIEILKQKIDKSESLGLAFADLNNSICLINNDNALKTNLFIITGFSTKLKEGTAKIIIKAGDIEKEFEINSAWITKPRTLINPEFAIKILEHVTPSDEVLNLTDGDEDEYYKNLKAYWEKFDQNKETAFNEVMNEFYQRADIALRDYSTPNNRDGTNTDRGKIYVKYGKPDNVERSYNEKDNILEIWTYSNINKKFVFSDNNGLGNFTLLK